MEQQNDFLTSVNAKVRVSYVKIISDLNFEYIFIWVQKSQFGLIANISSLGLIL